MAFVEGLFCVQTLHLGPVYLAVISQLAFLQGWPLRGVPLYSRSTVTMGIWTILIVDILMNNFKCQTVKVYSKLFRKMAIKFKGYKL